MSPPTTQEIITISEKATDALTELVTASVDGRYAASTHMVALAWMVGAFAYGMGKASGLPTEEILDDIIKGARAAADDAETSARGGLQ